MDAEATWALSEEETFPVYVSVCRRVCLEEMAHSLTYSIVK